VLSSYLDRSYFRDPDLTALGIKILYEKNI